MFLPAYLVILLTAGTMIPVYLMIDTNPEPTGKGYTVLPKEDDRYQVNSPTHTYTLPARLHEISGIATGTDGQFYCVQDESGMVYAYDPGSGKITDSIGFSGPGDYEELVLVEDRFYVLRSDATIFTFTHATPPSVMRISIPVACDNVEGLAYDPKRNGFYIACKSASENTDAGTRVISFFPANDPHSVSSEMIIGVDDLPGTGKKKSKFNPSALAVHPHTGELFVLSASNPHILIYQQQQLSGSITLSGDMYYQAEGITFATNGDMLISSEGSKDGDVSGMVMRIKME